MRIHRYRIKGDEGSYHPLDRVLGLAQSEASPGAREMICDLATRLPYRQAAEIFSRITGEDHSALSCWRVIQQEGARIRAEEGELISRIFDDGEAPEDEGDAPELVVVEADGTFLLAQREGQDRFEVKTGVFYTGKQRAGGRRHRRWRLLGKGCYATSASQDDFGKALASAGFSWVGLHRAQHVLCVHDGLDEYGATFADWFPDACHQIDYYHVSERIWEVSRCGPRPLREAQSSRVLGSFGLRPPDPLLEPDPI